MDWLLFSLNDLPHNLCPLLLPAAVNSRQIIFCLMRGMLCTLLNLPIFGVYLGRMGIYFGDSQRNGTPYPRSNFGDMLILWICIGSFGTVACYLRQLV